MSCEAAQSDADLSLNQRAAEALLQRSSLHKVGKYWLLITTAGGGVQIIHFSNRSSTTM